VMGGGLPLVAPEPQAMLVVKTMSKVCVCATDRYCDTRTR
jgi:hypothetical protein